MGRRIFVSTVLVLCLLGMGARPASASERLLNILNKVLIEVKSWVDEGSTNDLGAEGIETKYVSSSEGVAAGNDAEGQPESKIEENKNTNNISEDATCRTAQSKLPTVCPSGSSYLCIDTPSGSTVDSKVQITGTIDRAEKGYSRFSGFVQNEYTNKTTTIDEGLIQVLEDGHFSVDVELSDLGPYSVVLKVIPVIGSPEEKVVKVSKVKALNLDASNVSTIPDINSVEAVDGCLRVSVDLLQGCKNCDFIGTSTNGVIVSAVDTVVQDSGDEATFKVATNINTNGLFNISVPVKDGENNITIFACNAATGFERDACPQIGLKAFVGNSGGIKITIIEPKSLTSIFSAESMPLRFKVDGLKKIPTSSGGVCNEDTVTWEFNREQMLNLCPDADGVYSAQMNPMFGINLGIIRVAGPEGIVRYPVNFGWGRSARSYVKDGSLPNAVQLKIATSLISEKIMPSLNSGLGSQAFKDFLASLDDKKESKKVADAGVQDETQKRNFGEYKDLIPLCSSGKGGGSKSTGKMAMGKAPEIEELKIDPFTISENKIDFKIHAKNVRAWILEGQDADFDGEFDSEPRPLKLSFRLMEVTGKINVNKEEDGPVIVIEGLGSDCEYKHEDDCKGMPTLLSANNYIGDATDFGKFFVCDEDYPDISGEMVTRCRKMNQADNIVNGLVSETILDKINTLIYCDGSAMLTAIVRQALDETKFQIPLPDDRKVSIAASVGLADNGFVLNDKEISFIGNAIVTGPSGSIDPDFIIDPTEETAEKIVLPEGKDFKFVISESLINSALAGLTGQVGDDAPQGVLDWDIDEAFFERQGVKFDEKCNVEGDVPAICNFRPRVKDLLSGVPDYILNPDQKLLLRIRGSKKITPHIRINPELSAELAKTVSGDLIDLTMSDLDIMIFALQNDGKTIMSMNEFSKEPVPVIKLKLSGMLALEIEKLKINPENANEYVLPGAFRGDLSKIAIIPVPGSNMTDQPETKIINDLVSVLDLGLSENYKFNLKIPKKIELDESKNYYDLFNAFGLAKLEFGPQGLDLGFDETSNFIEVATDFTFGDLKPIE